MDRGPPLLVACLLTVASCGPSVAGPTAPGDQPVQASVTPVPNATKRTKPPASSKPQCPRSRRKYKPSATTNCLFREVYGARRDAATQADTYTIIESFGRVSLIRKGKRVDSERITSPTFHALKEYAHLPLGVFLLVGNSDPVAEVSVDDYIHAVDGALGALPSLEGLSDDQRKRCRKIAEASRAMLVKARTGPIPPDDLRSFASSMGPLVEKNASDAAFAYLERLDEVVQRWRENQLAEDWDDVRVLVRGPHQARRLHVSTQYFAGLFGECGDGLSYPGESQRLLFTEQGFERWESEDGDPKTLDPSGSNTYADLIGTTLVDADASEAFFGDRNRLSVDILAPGATKFANSRRFKTLPCP